MSVEEQQGRYVPLRKLGAGAMGEVWFGMDDLLQRPVAIKYLYGTDQAKLKENMLSEARMLARFSHTHITNIYDAIFDYGSEQVGLVMECVEGRDLAEILATEEVLSLDTILNITIGILRALAYAHQNEVVHRDIKPANVLVQADGVVKLTDFGMASLMSALAEGTKHIFGTPNYLSPEQAAGGPTDGRADLYSVGVMLFEMVCGRLPFAYKSVATILNAHLTDPPPSIREFAPEAPLVLEHVINRLLAKNPDDRYPSAEALITVLESIHDRHKFNQPHLPLLTPETHPLVGHTTELSQLQAIWTEVQTTGRPHFVALQGEMGVGKTRLIAEFVTKDVVDQGQAALVGRCDEFGVPYTPFAEILSTIFEMGLVTPQQITSEISLLLSQIPDLNDLFREFTTEYDDYFLDDPQLIQWQFCEAIQTILRELGPAVLLLENATLLDEASLSLIRFLLRRGRVPILFLAPCRDEETVVPWLETFQASEAAHLTLKPLTANLVERYLIDLLGGSVSQPLVTMVRQRTHGNPFFINELLPYLIAQEQCIQDQNGKWLFRASKMSSPSLPPTLQTVLAQRVNRLSEASQKTLAIAAIIGQEFDLDTWLALLGGEQQLSQALTALDEAMQFQMIRETGDNSYIFYPPDLATSFAETLSTPVRHFLHRQLAERLQKHANRAATLIGYHYTQAGLENEAVQFLEAAGQQAANANAIDEAIAYYEQVIALAPSQTRYERLGNLYHKQETPGKSIETLTQALEMAQQARDITGQARILNALALVFWTYDYYQEAEDQAAAVLRLSGVPEVERAVAQSHLGMVSWLCGKFIEAEYWCERAVAILKVQSAGANLAGAYNRLGLAYFARGKYREAKTVFKRSLDIRQTGHDYWGQGYCWNNLGKVATDEGDFTLAATHLETAENLFTNIDNTTGLLVVFSNQVRLCLQQGQSEAALILLTKALILAEQSPNTPNYCLIDLYLLMAETVLAENDFADATHWLDKALQLAAVSHNRAFIAQATRLQAYIQAANGEPTKADAVYQQAISQFEKSGTPAGVLRAKQHYAQFLTEQGQDEAAKALRDIVQQEAAQQGLVL